MNIELSVACECGKELEILYAKEFPHLLLTVEEHICEKSPRDEYTMEKQEKEYRKCPKCGKVVTKRIRKNIVIPDTYPIGKTTRNDHYLLKCDCGHEFHRYLLCGLCL